MVKVHFIPFVQYEVKTDLSYSEIVRKFSCEIFDKFYLIKTKGFRGWIKNKRFRISKILDHRNSFNPIIKGQIIEDHSGTLVRVKMTLHPLVLCFLVILLLLTSLFSLASADSLPDYFLALSFIIPVYLFFLVFFNLAVEQAQDAMNRLFEIK